MRSSCAALMLLAMMVPAMAQSTTTDRPASPNVRASEPTAIAEAIRTIGYNAMIDKDSGGDPMIRGKAEGLDYQILFYGCTQNVNCQSLQFFIGFRPESSRNFSLQKANEFNTRKRFARAYIAESGAARMEMDVYTGRGGLAQADFARVFQLWTSLLADFNKATD